MMGPLGRALTALTAVGVVTSTASAQTVPAGEGRLALLEAELERLEPLSGGRMGVDAIHLESGREVYLNADEAFPMASTYKVPIAVQLRTGVERGERSLEDMVEVEPADLHPGSGTLRRLFDDPGVVLSLRNLLELILLISDNSATDLTLRAAGGAEAVTARMLELGIQGIRVDRPTSLLIGDFLGVHGAPADGRISPAAWRELTEGVEPDERQAAAGSFAGDPRDTATPRGMAAPLRMIWRGEALGEEGTSLIRDILLRVETGEGRIKGMLPPGTDVAHKTGTIGATTNDVGVMVLPGEAGHVVTVVFVKDSDRPVPDRERAIAQVARAIHDFFLFNPAG